MPKSFQNHIIFFNNKMKMKKFGIRALSSQPVFYNFFQFYFRNIEKWTYFSCPKLEI